MDSSRVPLLIASPSRIDNMYKSVMLNGSESPYKTPLRTRHSLIKILNASKDSLDAADDSPNQQSKANLTSAKLSLSNLKMPTATIGSSMVHINHTRSISYQPSVLKNLEANPYRMRNEGHNLEQLLKPTVF